MDRKAVAKELRQRLFDFIEAERREALQDAAIDDLFEKVLALCEKPPTIVSPDLSGRTWTAASSSIRLTKDFRKSEPSLGCTIPATGQD